MSGTEEEMFERAVQATVAAKDAEIRRLTDRLTAVEKQLGVEQAYTRRTLLVVGRLQAMEAANFELFWAHCEDSALSADELKRRDDALAAINDLLAPLADPVG